MKNTFTLPNNYSKSLTIDLQKDKKLALLVNGLALIITIAMFIPAIILVPIGYFYNLDSPMKSLLNLLIIFVCMVLYLVLHEFVHGIGIKHFSKKKANYGFTGLYAFAGSDCYFNKKSYIIIALAPVVVWGVVFALLNIFMPIEYFWFAYILQIINISGAAGDIYVTLKFCRLPSDILVQDTGVAMSVFTKA